MQVTTEKLDGCIFRINYTFDNKEFTPKLMEYIHRIRLPGFRPGKVPLAVLGKMYGLDVIFREVFSGLVGDEWLKYLQEANLVQYSPAQFSTEEYVRNEPVVIHLTIETMPHVELPDYSTIKVVAPKTEVTDAMVQSAIAEALRKQVSRTVITDRPCNTGDVVGVDYSVRDEDSTVLNEYKDVMIRLGTGRFPKDVENQVIGMTIGEERDCTTHYADTYSDEKLRGKTVVFHVSLKSITEETIPALDDDFVQDVSDLNTVDEYVAEVRSDLEYRFRDQDFNDLGTRIISAFMEHSVIELPPSLVEDQKKAEEKADVESFARFGIDLYEYNAQNGVDREEVEASFERRARQNLASYLVVNELMNKEGISVTDEDFNAYIEDLRPVLKDRFDEYVANLKDADKESLRKECANAKLINTLKEKVEVTFVPAGDPALAASKPKYEQEDEEAEKAEEFEHMTGEADESETAAPEQPEEVTETAQEPAEDGKE